MFRYITFKPEHPSYYLNIEVQSSQGLTKRISGPGFFYVYTVVNREKGIIFEVLKEELKKFHIRLPEHYKEVYKQMSNKSLEEIFAGIIISKKLVEVEEKIEAIDKELEEKNQYIAKLKKELEEVKKQILLSS